MFSKNLKYLRNKHNLSQQKLANLINVNQTCVTRWKKGDRQPTMDVIIKIANVFNLPIGDLLTTDLTNNNQPTNHFKICDDVEVTIKGKMSIDNITKINEILLKEFKKQSIQK